MGFCLFAGDGVREGRCGTNRGLVDFRSVREDGPRGLLGMRRGSGAHGRLPWGRKWFAWAREQQVKIGNKLGLTSLAVLLAWQ